MFFKSDIIFSCNCKFISNSMFWSSKTWFFMMISRKSRFYLDLIFFGISSLIFFVPLMLSNSCKFVIYFFKIFFWVFNFNVWIVFVWDLISSMFFFPYGVDSSNSHFFNNIISPCFFFISNILIEFCSSISIRALLSCILSLKFSKICSLIFLISWAYSNLPQVQVCPVCWGRLLHF